MDGNAPNLDRTGPLIQEPRLRVDIFRSTPKSNRVAITFTERGRTEISGPGFGGDFLLERGFDVIAFKLIENTWYQGVTSEQLAVVREAASHYSERVSYGSSMGAHAAIRFAASLGVDRVLALSPLFDICWPHDKRYAEDREAIQTDMMSREMISSSCKYFVVYDPFDPDIHHVAAFQKVVPAENLIPIKVPCSGHPSGYYLKEAGSLSDVVMSTLSEGVAPKNTWRALGRPLSRHGFRFVAKCLERKKFRAADKVNARLVASKPGNAEYQLQKSRIAHALGRRDEAIAAGLLSCLAAPNHPSIQGYVAQYLVSIDRLVEASSIVEIGLINHPAWEGLKTLRTKIAARLNP